MKSLTIEGLLGLKPQHHSTEWIEHVVDETVLITGAGGYIGREICKRVAGAHPKRVVLVENNEFALYEVHRSLKKYVGKTELIPLLASYGSVTALEAVRMFNPVVIHAGAYKHVPMVERNPVEGVQNNVLEFHKLAQVCYQSAKRLVVVSSDKAVNPTNVMGATKKLVEDIARAAGPIKTTIVRFGNVMWSSGSVLPLFMEQLNHPDRTVTITHPEVDRFFMSVEQAVNLVLQSIALPSPGIYALDMGEPVKIVDLVAELARNMEVDGYFTKFTGLRPGEKLHEELTLGDNLQPTRHPEILEAREHHPSYVTSKMAEEFIGHCATMDAGKIRQALQKYVKGYVPMCGIVDDLWLAKNVFPAEEMLEDCFAPTVPAKETK